MALETVTISWDEQDVGQAGLSGVITFTLSQPLTDTVDGVTVEPVPDPYPFANSTGSSRPLVANDSPLAAPSGTWYTIAVNISGMPSRSFTAPILHANGASQTLAFLQSQAIVPVIPTASYLETTGGTMAGPLVIDGGLILNSDVAPAVVTLTDATVIAVSAALGNDFEVTLGGNRTLGTPSGGTDGQKICICVTQDGAGGRTLAYSPAWEFGAASAPVLSTGAGYNDLLGFRYNAAKGKWQFLGPSLGFA